MRKLITTFNKMQKIWKFMQMKEYDEVMTHQRELLEKLIASARASSPFTRSSIAIFLSLYRISGNSRPSPSRSLWQTSTTGRLIAL